MYQIACPACGAPVAFRSATSVMAVCAYCRSTLLRDADSVRDIGKMSAVLEDYSPIQITTSGTFEGRNFSVVGRIQLQYDAGYWNEWYLWFDDGTAGWLSDASGQYVITVPVAEGLPQAPQFARITPAANLRYDNADWIAADVREARCVAGEGELPMQVGQGWVARVADYRSARRFLSLDYSDGDVPSLFVGKSVTLDSMRAQLLRSREQIVEKAGRLSGALTQLDCPACGAQLSYLAAQAQHLVCQVCHAEIGMQGDKAGVLATHREMEAVETTLALGDTAAINGDKWLLIGVMRCRERSSDGEEWTEYLLHHPNKGFRWLVETEESWDYVSVLDEWPLMMGSQVRLDGRAFTKTYEYGREVIYAAGAFNWRVRVGEVVRVSEYANGTQNVTAERSDSELVFSHGNRVSASTVAQWFKDPGIAAGRVTGDSAAKVTVPYRTSGRVEDEGWGTSSFAWIFTVLLLALNLPLLLSGFGSLETSFFGLIALWWPIWKSDGDWEDD